MPSPNRPNPRTPKGRYGYLMREAVNESGRPVLLAFDRTQYYRDSRGCLHRVHPKKQVPTPEGK